RGIALAVSLALPLRALAVGDVAVDRHEAAARNRIVTDLEHRAVGADALDVVTGVEALLDARDLPLDVDRAELAALRQVPDEVRIGGLGGGEVLREVGHLLQFPGS